MKRLLFTLLISLTLSANAYAGWFGFEWGIDSDTVYQELERRQKLWPNIYSKLRKVYAGTIIQYNSEYGSFETVFTFTDDKKLEEIYMETKNPETCKKTKLNLTERYKGYIGNPDEKPIALLYWQTLDNKVIFRYQSVPTQPKGVEHGQIACDIRATDLTMPLPF